MASGALTRISPGNHPSVPRTPRIERALDLLFPPVCVGCHRVGGWLCPRCWNQVEWLHTATCGVCGRQSAVNPCPGCAPGRSSLDAILAVAHFKEPARSAVHALKYEDRHAISGLMGRLMALPATDLAADAVVHVALHPRRKRERGYDQAAMLARHVAHGLHLPFLGSAVRRVRYTSQQIALSRDERDRNVRDAFTASLPSRIRHVVLVDDVFTTGSTLRAAATALRGAGVETVTGLVFAVADHAT
jgi:ComF family protein